MIHAIVEVVIAERSAPYYGDDECYFCGEHVWRRVPHNFPQVCRECADREVWQYNRERDAA